jgi:Domain of unknown function (DUF5606)
MELLEKIASVSGKSGLYRILKPGRSGVIVETLDDKQEKSMLGPTARVSILKDISIFMADGREAMPLADILRNVHANYKDQSLDVKALSDYQLTDFMTAVAPDYDTERVYLSDMRKLANWYNALKKYVPEVFDEVKEEAETAEETSETTEEISAATEETTSEEAAETPTAAAPTATEE